MQLVLERFLCKSRRDFGVPPTKSTRVRSTENSSRERSPFQAFSTSAPPRDYVRHVPVPFRRSPVPAGGRHRQAPTLAFTRRPSTERIRDSSRRRCRQMRLWNPGGCSAADSLSVRGMKQTPHGDEGKKKTIVACELW
jgi:hypothetical protein